MTVSPEEKKNWPPFPVEPMAVQAPSDTDLTNPSQEPARWSSFGYPIRLPPPSMFLKAALTVCLLTAAPATASTTWGDLQAITRAIAFQEGAPKGSSVLGILVQPEQPASLAEASELENLLGRGGKIDGMAITIRLVTLDEARSAAGINALLIPESNAPAYDRIAAALSGVSLLSVGTDPICVAAGACIMGVQTGDRTEITVNRARSEAAGIRFTAAFRLVIKEL